MVDRLKIIIIIIIDRLIITFFFLGASAIAHCSYKMFQKIQAR
jgi:hypothetical protein